MQEYGPGRRPRAERRTAPSSRRASAGRAGSRLRRFRRYVAVRLALVALVAIAVAVLRTHGPPFDLPGRRADVVASAAVALDDVPPSSREVHLTFDDGPTSETTPLVLDLLAEYDARATFFPVGAQVEDGADILRRAVTDGHAIGNHTWRHDRLAGVDAVDFEQAVARTQAAVEGATGVTPRCLRPPGGVIDDSARSRAVAAGMTLELWTVDPQDWRRPGSDAIAASVLEHLDGPNEVVLLHDGGGDRTQTVEALRRILDELSSRGYRFTPIPGC